MNVPACLKSFYSTLVVCCVFYVLSVSDLEGSKDKIRFTFGGELGFPTSNTVNSLVELHE